MKKIDKVINIIREQMVAGTGGFTSSADPKGPVAGYDVPIDFRKRKYKKVPFFYRDLIKKLYKNK